jgi:hypothetical protein
MSLIVMKKSTGISFKRAVLIAISVPLISGSFGFYLRGSVSSQSQEEVAVYYISQDEILKLEKMRIEGGETSKRSLFFGKPKYAIQLIERFKSEIEQEWNGSKNRDKYQIGKVTNKAGKEIGRNIVLISEGKIFGKNTKSISRQVHKEIVEELNGSRRIKRFIKL